MQKEQKIRAVILFLETLENTPAPYPTQLNNQHLYKMYFTYVLRSKKDGKNYIGYSNDVDSRLEKHNNGEVTSTAYRRPFELIYYEACLNKADALRRERYLKTYQGRQFLGKRLKEWLKE